MVFIRFSDVISGFLAKDRRNLSHGSSIVCVEELAAAAGPWAGSQELARSAGVAPERGISTHKRAFFAWPRSFEGHAQCAIVHPVRGGLQAGAARVFYNRLLPRGLLAIAACVLAAMPACSHRRPPASAVRAGDPAIVRQLLSGFYGVESKNYRWTAGEFSVALRPPPGEGGTLKLEFFIPGAQIDAIGPMTLTADVDDYELDCKTYTAGGMYTYTREVPAEALESNLVVVHFAFDKVAKPSERDARQLGAVFSSAGLYPRLYPR
jgi:hypothetical protein